MEKKVFKYVNYVYRNKFISNFISNLMRRGNKNKMELTLNLIFKIIKLRIKFNPIFLFFEAIEKLKPIIDLKKIVRRRRRKKIKEMIPIQITISSQFKRASFFLIESTKKLEFNFFLSLRLVEELISLFFFHRGNSIKKKISLYKYTKFKKYKRYFRW